MSGLRQIFRQAKQLPVPVQTKLKHNIRRVYQSKEISIEEKTDGQAALFRLICWLTEKARDDSVLFKHFK
jgi:hypothetical protein